MNYMKRRKSIGGYVFGGCLALLLAAPLLLGDGKVTQPAIADPVTAWHIIDLRFSVEQGRSAIITVGYFRQSGARDHVGEPGGQRAQRLRAGRRNQ